MLIAVQPSSEYCTERIYYGLRHWSMPKRNILEKNIAFLISDLLDPVSSVSRLANYTVKVLSAGGTIILIVDNDWNYQK